MEKVVPTAIDTTENITTIPNMTRQNRVISAILARFTDVRYPLAMLAVITGYGFASADNFAPSAICALVGLAAAAGPDFHAWIHRVLAAEDAALDGIEPDGAYVGDGVPRDQGGHEYEPLEWSGGRLQV
jgi:hypothetical protein